MAAYLALDQGTTSSRAIVFDETCNELGKAQFEFEQHFPGPGMVEHDAEEIWSTQWRAAQDAWRAAGSPEIDGVGITNQRETVVVFDRSSGEPIHNAIVWQDRRTARQLETLTASGCADMVRERTGLPLDPYFSAAKIAHIVDAVDGGRAAAERGDLAAGTIDSWLLYKLSGGDVFATEPSNASRTSLFDIREGDWSDELLDLFRVPRAMLPEVRDSAGEFGRARDTDWPITGVLGDQQAALFGQGCTQPGLAKCTYGTGAFLLVNTGAEPAPPEHGVLATVAWRTGGELTYALEGSVMVSGALIQWLRDGLGIIESAAEVEALARTVDDSGGVVIVPAFAGLGTPHWDADARGLIIGLTRGTTRAHLARAALDAMALSVRDVQVAMRSAMGSDFECLRVDGGAAANDLLLELQARASRIPVVRPANLETTALGACRMAMLGAGREPAPLAELGEDCFEPGSVVDEGMVRRWESAIERARGWAR